MERLMGKLVYLLLLAGIMLIFSGCGGAAGGSGDATGDGGDDNSATTYKVGGTISGLWSGVLTLQLNGDTTFEFSESGDYSLATKLEEGTAYEITVYRNPTTTSKVRGRDFDGGDDGSYSVQNGGTPITTNCTIDNGSGTVAQSDITNIEITCVNHYYFQVYNSDSGRIELARTDGTAAGSERVTGFEANTGNESYDLRELTNFAGNLYFASVHNTLGEGLYKVEGTECTRLKSFSGGGSGNVKELTVVNDTLFFSAMDHTDNDTRLWKSDGTATGTVVVRGLWKTGDGNDGAGYGGSPNNMIAYNDELYFSGDNVGGVGRELWKSNGTYDGTVVVSDIYSGSDSSSPQYLVEMGGKLYFSANDGVLNQEVWVSDGTSDNDTRLSDTNHEIGAPEQLTVVNDTLFFLAADNDDSAYDDIWKTTGGAAQKVFTLNGSGYGGVDYLTNVNGKLFLAGPDDDNDNELWITDGSDDTRIDVFAGAANDGSPKYITAVNGKAFFNATSSSDDGAELFISDGTSLGTTMVRNIHIGESSSSNPNMFIDFNGVLLFFANSMSGAGLWKSDGTYDGTSEVTKLTVSDGGGADVP